MTATIREIAAAKAPAKAAKAPAPYTVAVARRRCGWMVKVAVRDANGAVAADEKRGVVLCKLYASEAVAKSDARHIRAMAGRGHGWVWSLPMEYNFHDSEAASVAAYLGERGVAASAEWSLSV